MSVRRFASVASALVVAGIAALASYSHMRHLAVQYGQDRVIATLLPISVDGMMVVATVALGDGRRFRWSAWLAFWTGVAASVVANVLAAQPSAIARCISAWPAVAFLLVIEVITRGGRFRAAGVATLADLRESPAQGGAHVGTTLPGAPVPTTVDSTADLPEPAVPDMTGNAPKTRKPRSDNAADRVAKLRARRPDISQAEAARRLKVSPRTVARHWPVTQPDTSEDTQPVNGGPVPASVVTDAHEFADAAAPASPN